MAHPLEGLIAPDDVSEVAENEGLVFDDDRTAILEAMRSIDVQACPGSGKTTLIAAKLILLAKKWPLRHQGICVLSHTNVAKDEIIDRLKRSKTIEAQRLLSYPHFIGTIQEFVNRFMALPSLRSSGIRDITVDNDEYAKVARLLLNQNQFGWLQGTLNGLGNSDAQEGFLRATFRFIAQDGLVVNISRRPRAWQQPNNLQRAQRALGQLKQYLDERGFYLYRDMYTHAQIACSFNEELPKAIRARFPCVFLDEMQDTQKFQDEILCKVFPLDDPNLIVQRFGDPDQAIFHGMGSEEPNESFNGKSKDDMDFVVHKSHRFDDILAGKIKPLSLNEIPLETELSDAALDVRSEAHINGGSFEHTVIVFDDATRESVIEHFTEIVSSQFTVERKQSADFKVKVVGAVGKDIDADNQFRLGHYWRSYKKAKSKTNFKPASLIEAARYCRKSKAADWAGNYKLLLDCILKLLRLADKKDVEGRYFSVTSLREFLKATHEWKSFRESIHFMLNGKYQLDQEFWNGISTVLTTIFGLANLSAEATAYLAFADDEAPAEPEEEWPEGVRAIPQPENRVKHLDGFRIELSTIHGVKGETHDATLVLETKYYKFDMEKMVPFLAERPTHGDGADQQSLARPSSQRDVKFMRQFYVAMSRPKHLLCLAVHTKRISKPQKQSLLALGWAVDELPALT